MKKKGLIALALIVSLALAGTFNSFAGVTAAIDISVYDIKSQELRTNIYYNHYDAESDLIPIKLNERFGFFSSDETDISSLIFINRNGETVIPANPNWELVAGFRHGVALVKDKATGIVSRIDTSGNVLGTVDMNIVDTYFVHLLPVDSQYSYYYIVGNGNEDNFPEDNFSVVFINRSGEKKEINLKELGFHSMDFFDENGKAALFTGSYRGVRTSSYGERIIASWNAYNLTQTAYIDINGNIVDGVITEQSKKYEKENISIDKEGKDYVCEIYTLKHLEYPYHGYEIYQNGVPTGIMLYDIKGADNHTVIGYESVEQVYDYGYHYFAPGRLMIYHIY